MPTFTPHYNGKGSIKLDVSHLSCTLHETTACVSRTSSTHKATGSMYVQVHTLCCLVTALCVRESYEVFGSRSVSNCSLKGLRTQAITNSLLRRINKPQCPTRAEIVCQQYDKHSTCYVWSVTICTTTSLELKTIGRVVYDHHHIRKTSDERAPIITCA